MKFESFARAVENLDEDLPALCELARSRMPEPPDLVLAFATCHFEDQSEAICRALNDHFDSALVTGCSAEGVIGPDSEHERVPAVSLMLARMPGVNLVPFRMEAAELSDLESVQAAVAGIEADPIDEPTFIFLGDPFSVPVKPVLQAMDERFPGRPVLGGMVSGCDGPGQAVLILGENVFRDGAIGVAVVGNVEVRTVVSQGCRPIGERFVITRGRGNVIEHLGGRPALQQLRESLRKLSGDDLALAQRSLFIGLAIDEHKGEFRRGDFVIRQILAGDSASGAIVVGDEIRVGMSVQFHVRDADSADEDLRALLAPVADGGSPAGALMFTCNGRGTRMWEKPNHDVGVLRGTHRNTPVAGFFAAGELGPIDGRNLVHGHTASIGLFYPREVPA